MKGFKPKKDKQEQIPVTATENTVAAETETGSAADVEAIMRKYDRESNTRVWEGKPKVVVGCILAAFSLFCIYVTLFANFLEQVRLSSFLGLIIVMGFLTFPAKKGHVKVNHMPWYDVVLMVAGATAFFYFTINVPTFAKMRLPLKLKDPLYIAMGIIGILVMCELCRRSVGLPILCVAGAFLLYTIYFYIKDGKMLQNVVHELFYNENGMLSTPVNVCSKYIVVFIIFGAFLEKTGIAEFFISLANSLTGRFAGGPAKVAVISSALCGMVSGSSVGNTVTTGSVTIPMMKKTGYKPEFAGAVEAAASTGGQIMPPIMGAAAFLMADYVGVPYSDIIVRAILPACLYFLGIFLAVHLEAKKLGLKGISRDQLPKMRKLIKDTYLLLPLAILIYLVCSNTRTMQFSAAVAIVATIVVGIVNNKVKEYRNWTKSNPKKSEYEPITVEMTEEDSGKEDSVKGLFRYYGRKFKKWDKQSQEDGIFTIRNVWEALENGGRSCISVGVACAIAGIICGCLTVTGLASTVINAIVQLSGSHMFVALILTMLCCIVLGMGVPTTANYCIMASTCAPILIQMGVPVIAAHFFVFYFGIVADITPPVALAAYAGSAIAKGNPMKTGVTATRLAIAAFIIPFIFALSPAMLFINTTWVEVLQIIVTSVIGMYGIASGLSGYMLKPMNIFERIVAVAGGLLLIIPGTMTDLFGVVLVGLIALIQYLSKPKAQKAAE